MLCKFAHWICTNRPLDNSLRTQMSTLLNFILHAFVPLRWVSLQPFPEQAVYAFQLRGVFLNAVFLLDSLLLPLLVSGLLHKTCRRL